MRQPPAILVKIRDAIMLATEEKLSIEELDKIVCLGLEMAFNLGRIEATTTIIIYSRE